MATFGLSAPWEIYVTELEQLFMYDDEVHVIFDRDGMTVRLYVDDGYKAEALESLLPIEKQFGTMTLHIVVVPANPMPHDTRMNKRALFERAFDGNGALSFTKVVRNVFPNDLVYVVFQNRVVQYFNDDLGDVYGCCSTLYQNIAADVFEPQDGVFFCTDKPSDPKAASLEPEWP